LQIVVGLGNFPAAYHRTPHNIGRLAVEALARRWRLEWVEKKDVLDAAVREGRAVLVAPRSYMNTSGPAVLWARNRWKAPLEDVWVVCDDFTLPWGRLRIRRDGRSGGHNGLESVIQSLGSTAFPRLRVGVGPVPEGMDPKDFVLGKQPRERLEKLAEQAADALEAAMDEGLESAMNRFNAARK